MPATPKIADFFPFPEARPAQEKALIAIEKAHAAGKKFVILEIPTGGGKSGIAVAAAQWAEAVLGAGAYILSPQKTLTSQYINDFGQIGLRELRGRNSYECAEFGTNCERGSVLRGNDKDVCESCPYRVAKDDFIASSMGVTNFSYYLNEMQYAGELGHRSMLILDEGHNTENALLGETDIEINRRHQSEYGIGWLPRSSGIEKYHEWIEKAVSPGVENFIQQVENTKPASADDRIASSQKISSARKMLFRLARFLKADELHQWVAWTSDQNTVTIRPLTPKLHAGRMLFDHADMVIIMSATILDFRTFTRSLGINENDCELLALPSDFPEENRRIQYRPVGLMARGSQDGTLPLLASTICSLLEHLHPTEKGIVHTHTHKINKYLVENLGNLSSRIITYYDSRDRERALKAHCSSPRPTVLFSPGMAEGLDLKDQLSRFQIICKVPYPFLDQYTRSRMKVDPAWYQWRTALTLVQATGRSVRSRQDYALTYVLDANFERFIGENKNYLPRWWLDAIDWPKKEPASVSVQLPQKKGSA